MIMMNYREVDFTYYLKLTEGMSFLIYSFNKRSNLFLEC